MVFICCFFLVALFTISNFTGKIFLARLFGESKPGMQILTGLITLVSIFAVCVTRGKTILLPVVILFGIELFRNRASIRTFLNVEKVKEIKWLLLLSTILTALAWFLYILPLGVDLTFNLDHVFYGKLADFMFGTNTETKNLNYFLDGKNYTEVYHYFDIWLYAIIKNVLRVTTNQSVFIGVFLVFLPLVFQCLKDVADKLYPGSKNVLVTIAATALVTKLSGSTFIFDLFNEDSGYADICIHNYPKLILLFVFLVTYLYAMLFSEIRTVMLLCILFSLSFSTVLPACAGCAFLFYLNEYRKKVFQLRNLKFLLPLLLTLLYIYLFYSAFSNPVEQQLTHDDSIPFDAVSLRTRINIAVKTVIYMFLGTLPIFILFFLYRKNINFLILKKAGFWLLAGSLTGIAAWMLIYILPDSVQLWGTHYYCAVAFIFVLSWIICLKNRKIAAFVVLSIFIAADIFIPGTSKSHLLDADFNASNYRSLDGKKIAVFNDATNVKSVFDANESVFFSGLSNLMSFTEARPISFSVVEFKPENAIFEKIVTQSNLYQLKPFSLGRGEAFYVSYQDSLLHNLAIEYVAVHKNRTLPLVLKKYHLGKLAVNDINYRFYRLSTKNTLQ